MAIVRGSFYQRLSSFYFCYFAFIGAFAPYFALYLKSLGYSAAEIGLLLAVNPVARIFGPNLWGWLSDHYRARAQLIRLTAVGTAVVFVAVFFNHGFAWMFAALLLLNVFLLVAGMFLHSTAAIILIVPIVLPLIRQIGVDPIHFGVIVTINLGVGQQTPPVATVLFTTAAIARLSFWEVFKTGWPFTLVLALVTLLVTYVPWLSLGPLALVDW